MTREELERIKNLMPVIQCWLDHKSVQWDLASNPGGDWTVYCGDHPPFLDPRYVWRIKPEPRTVPWTQADVPPVCYIRDKMHSAFIPEWMVNGVSAAGVYISGTLYMFAYLYTDQEYSTDRKDGSWKPCRKEVV